MTTLREAAQMALDALQESKPIDINDPSAFYRSAHAIEALRAALANEFTPDWDAMAVMVEEQQRMAKRIEELEAELAQPEQEPVAWADKHDIEREGHDFYANRQQPAKNGVPLYTAPPKREWQGLTDEEIKATWSQLWHDLNNGKFAASDDPSQTTTVMFARAIEAKLKEKNT